MEWEFSSYIGGCETHNVVLFSQRLELKPSSLYGLETVPPTITGPIMALGGGRNGQRLRRDGK